MTPPYPQPLRLSTTKIDNGSLSAPTDRMDSGRPPGFGWGLPSRPSALALILVPRRAISGRWPCPEGPLRGVERLQGVLQDVDHVSKGSFRACRKHCDRHQRDFADPLGFGWGLPTRPSALALIKSELA